MKFVNAGVLLAIVIVGVIVGIVSQQVKAIIGQNQDLTEKVEGIDGTLTEIQKELLMTVSKDMSAIIRQLEALSSSEELSNIIRQLEALSYEIDTLQVKTDQIRTSIGENKGSPQPALTCVKFGNNHKGDVGVVNKCDSPIDLRFCLTAIGDQGFLPAAGEWYEMGCGDGFGDRSPGFYKTRPPVTTSVCSCG